MSDEKTEEPTEKKLDDAKKKGQGPKSQDVNAAAGMITSTVLLSACGGFAAPHLLKLFDIVDKYGWQVKTNHDMVALIQDMAVEGLWMIFPFLAASVMVGFIAAFAQTGVVISFESITPNFDKVNPASGIKKVFSLKSVIEFIKMLGKTIAFGAVLYNIIIGLFPLLVGASMQSPADIVQIAMTAILKLFTAACIVFVIMGPVDWAIQKWMFIRDQKMSKDEIKREYKESEGDPQMKGQRKQIAHEMANSAPQQKVPGASVVVTNPTHYAVALYFKPGHTPLPVVVCKGMDEEAAVIRALAEKHHIPMVSNPPLARALYKVAIDDSIPEPLFDAVAAVLRWVAIVGQFSNGLTGAMPSASATNSKE
ncbi:type III secretion system export apparatus subunit SctU [Aquincola sp. S2]|uniref:Type III secretion system export apparatus subunit SctU n=1 Tax=Pseudaquabacterium terrae TaxID=2732868 RepID=A0ABX2EIU6_9BURK|nr:type III secretion system export apparatus subunit SctU [Aquabacterium terrae]NRF68491.1 type III secretion system export apparatus subunit SctU [Aquabacterium terrae]